MQIIDGDAAFVSLNTEKNWITTLLTFWMIRRNDDVYHGFRHQFVTFALSVSNNGQILPI